MPNPKNMQTLYTLPAPLYCPGAPLRVLSGRLLGDGTLLYCQLSLQSLSAAEIRKVTVGVQTLDKDGRPMGLELPHRYLVKAARDDCFGDKELLTLPLDGAASFRARVLRVDFAEGEPWRADGVWASMPVQPSLEESYGDKELAEQFRIRYGRDCKCRIITVEDLWLCTCEAVNRESEASCHRCHRVRSALENVSADALRDESESRARKEPLRLAESKRENRALLKKLLLGAAIVLPILILILGLLTAVPRELERKNIYEGAQWLAGVGEFDAAREAFASLGEYRDSQEMAGVGLDYMHASELMRRAQQDDPSALQLAGHTRADLDDGNSAATLLYEAAQKEFEALGDYRNSAELAQKCAEGLEESQKALLQASYDRAAALLDAGQLSAARQAYLALGAEEEAKEPAYRKAQALTAFIQRYNIRGVYAQLSMEPGDMNLFSMSKDTALTLGSQSVADLLASCGQDPVDLQLEDEPAPGMLPLDQAVIELIGTLEDYRDSAAMLTTIADATDYTHEFFTLCENGDIYGAYEWLLRYEGDFENREAWLHDLETYMPYCGSWNLYLGDSTVIPLTLGRDGKCMSFRSRVLLQNGMATLRLTDAGGEYSVDLYADQGADRFSNVVDENAHYLVVITNSGHLSYLRYRSGGKLVSSCEYEPAQ